MERASEGWLGTHSHYPCNCTQKNWRPLKLGNMLSPRESLCFWESICTIDKLFTLSFFLKNLRIKQLIFIKMNLNGTIIDFEFTLDDLRLENHDPDQFSGLFDNCFIKITLLLSYFLAYLSLPAMGLVIWFEISGQAGQYRTMINKMTLYNFHFSWNLITNLLFNLF